MNGLSTITNFTAGATNRPGHFKSIWNNAKNKPNQSTLISSHCHQVQFHQEKRFDQTFSDGKKMSEIQRTLERALSIFNKGRLTFRSLKNVSKIQRTVERALSIFNKGRLTFRSLKNVLLIPHTLRTRGNKSYLTCRYLIAINL